VQLTLSVLKSLARLPVSEREAILASLSDKQVEQLQYDWVSRSLSRPFWLSDTENASDPR
jgi:hypothetical protein